MTRERSGYVQATEASHADFATGSIDIATLVAAACGGRLPVVAEHLISAIELVTIYNTLALMPKSSKRSTSRKDNTQHAAGDPLAREACGVLGEGFWTYAEGVVLTHGTCDG